MFEWLLQIMVSFEYIEFQAVSHRFVICTKNAITMKQQRGSLVLFVNGNNVIYQRDSLGVCADFTYHLLDGFRMIKLVDIAVDKWRLDYWDKSPPRSMRVIKTESWSTVFSQYDLTEVNPD